MLVLTRAIEEKLIIGNGEITLTVVEIQGNKVRLGIDAPKHVTILRQEVFDKIHSKQDNRELELVEA